MTIFEHDSSPSTSGCIAFNGTLGWQVATEEKLSIRTISDHFKLEDTSRMVPTIIVQLLANE